MAKKSKPNIKYNLIDILLFLTPFLYGLFPIWSLCLLGIVCVIGIIYKFSKEKRLLVPKGPKVYLLIIYLISFLFTEFVAVDKGMNLLAFIKNIPILLFIILLAQYDNNEEEKNRHLYMVSISSTISVLFSLFLMLIPNSGVYLDNRLHGIFYYANSYGLFLLVGAIILFLKKERKWYDYLMLAVLFVGIILTNSRAIIIMTLVFSIASLFFNKHRIKSAISAIVCFIIMFIGAYFVFNMEKRVSTEMLGSSEFISRIIYYEDSAKLISSHPLGLGYEGFWYEQAKEQTGIYDARFVHSSLIQVCLDVGIIPAVVLIVLLFLIFFDKKQTAISRIIMLAILGHSLIDIDLEYIYFILIITLFMNNDTVVVASKKIIYAVSVPLLCILSWIFLGDTLFYVKEYKTAIEIIPFHSDALQEVLYSTSAKDEQLEYANKVLKYNQNVSGAYEALRNKALEDNKFDEAISNEEKRLSLNKYKIDNYLSYTSLLTEAINYYNNNNEPEKAIDCVKKIVNIETSINNVLSNTNPLCFKTIHTPELDIPEELQSLIDYSKEILEKNT